MILLFVVMEGGPKPWYPLPLVMSVLANPNSPVSNQGGGARARQIQWPQQASEPKWPQSLGFSKRKGKCKDKGQIEEPRVVTACQDVKALAAAILAQTFLCLSLLDVKEPSEFLKLESGSVAMPF